jgi:hypothetical protein
VVIGRSSYRGASDDADILAAPLPPPPVFTPDIDTVRAEATALVAKAPLPLRQSHGWHLQIQKLLKADEERARRQSPDGFLSWDKPIFDSPFERRRLKILNALFLCLTRCGMRPHVSQKEGRSISVTVGATSVPLVLDSATAIKQIEREQEGFAFTPRRPTDRMRLAIAHWWSGENPRPSWEDRPGEPLERRLREIAVEIVVVAEQFVRHAALADHAWRTKRRAELEEGERRRLAEEERRRREHLARLEKARVDHLLAQAHALHQAQQIRLYIEAVRTINGSTADPMTDADLEAWSTWASAQADRIDPIVSGAFKDRPATEGGREP